MLRKTKEAVIAELKAKGIEFDENAKYNDLYKLNRFHSAKKEMPEKSILDVVKPVAPAEEEFAPVFPEKSDDILNKPIFPAALIERAKSVGFADEQIATYTDPKALEMACDRIRPQVTQHHPQPKKKRQLYKPFRDEPKGEPAQATFTSEISVFRASNLVRASYDDSNLGVFCRQHRPKILMDSIQRVTVIRNYVPNKKDILTTTFVIDYLQKG